jgi:hypothetical protein
MTKLFLFLVIGFFIAELMLAFVAILNICKYNGAVIKLNNFISVKKSSITFFFMDLRAIMQSAKEAIEHMKKIVNEKKTEYLYNVIKTFIVYLSIFSLKGKYKKVVIGVQLVKEIYEGINET